jgi:hypothetical protein
MTIAAIIGVGVVGILLVWLNNRRNVFNSMDEINATRKAIREAQRKAKQF